MLTPRGFGLLLAAAGLWVTARSFGVAELQIAAVAAVLLVATAAGFCRFTPIRLEVDRVARPAALFFDTEATVELVLTNSSRLPTTGLALRDRVPDELPGPATTRIPAIPAGGRVTLRYRLLGVARGRFSLGPLAVTVVDPFGLARHDRALTGTSTLTVYPPVWQLPNGVPLGGASSTERGGRRRLAANSEDFAKIRDYVRGDDLRTVHWASTAHRGKLMVRQGESAEQARAVVLLDVRAQRHAGTGPTASIETAVAAAASAGFHLASRGRSIVLVERPGPQPARDWEGCLERLAEVGTTDVDYDELLRQLARGAAGDGTLVAVTTVPDATELRQLVRVGRNFATPIALLVDTGTRGPRGGVDRHSAVTALRSAGWRVGLIERGGRIDTAWRELMLGDRGTPTATVMGADV